MSAARPSPPDQPDRLVVGITGASGAPYAAQLMRRLGEWYPGEVHLIMSSVGEQVLRYECSPAQLEYVFGFPRLVRHGAGDFWAGPSSGSYLTRGMVVIPCSMGHLGHLAAGTSHDLIARAADVALKEARPLVLVPREAPLNRIHLKNLLATHDAGAHLVPAMPAFYHHPETIEDLLDTVVARVLDLLAIPHQVGLRWREPLPVDAPLEA
ncbi:MAG TPA: UbiX family flavin prenyltransferase [bacterium]|nr:UbiX family flavin prenyltransferase [bacterium]